MRIRTALAAGILCFAALGRAQTPAPTPRTAADDQARREPRRRGGARHPGLDRRGLPALHRVAGRRVHELEPEAPRDADLDPVRQHEPGPRREGARGRALAADLLSRPGGRGRLRPGRRRRLRLLQGQGRRRVLPALSLRLRGGLDHAPDRRQVAQHRAHLVQLGPLDRLRLDAAHRRRRGHLRPGSEGPEDRPPGGRAEGRRLGGRGLVPGRQAAAARGGDLDQRDVPVARRRRHREDDAPDAQGRRSRGLGRRAVRARRQGPLRHLRPRFRVPAPRVHGPRDEGRGAADAGHRRRGRLRPLARRQDDRVRDQREGRQRPPALRHRDAHGEAGPEASLRRHRRRRLAPGRHAHRLHDDLGALERRRVLLRAGDGQGRALDLQRDRRPERGELRRAGARHLEGLRRPRDLGLPLSSARREVSRKAARRRGHPRRPRRARSARATWGATTT